MVQNYKLKNSPNYNASRTSTYYFISLTRKQFFFSGTRLLRTLAITDTNPPPRVTAMMGIDVFGKLPLGK